MCFPVNIARFFSVFWTISMLNFNCALENLHTMNDLYFTNFLSERERLDALRKVPVIAAFANRFKQLFPESLIHNFY